MMARASGYLQTDRARGLLSGPQSGLPDRVSVVKGYQLGIPLAEIPLGTRPARLERILLSPLIVAGVRVAPGRASRTRVPARLTFRVDLLLVILLTIYWVGTYGWYWFFFVPWTYGPI
jgi:hypothetical protein